MAGYTRTDTSNNIANGNVIDADDLDREFNAVEAAFSTADGHAHSGQAGDGGPINVIGPAQEYVGTATSLSPKGNNLYDLGATSQQWKDVYVAGTANLAGVAIEGGNIDGTVIGDSTPAAGNFTTVLTTGNLTVGGTFTVDEVSLVTGTIDSAVITTADINGGNIDGTVIGATTPAAGTFTTAVATDLTVNGDITVTGTVDGVDVAQLKTDFDALDLSVEENQDAFSIVAVDAIGGTVNLTADAPQDTLSIDAGTGITLDANPTTDTLTIINSAPDQTVSLTAGTNIGITGTYPNFTISNTASAEEIVINAGNGLNVSGTYPVFNLENTSPDQTVTITGGVGVSVTGTYPNFNIASTIAEGDLYYADGTSIVLNTETNVFSHADTSSASPVVNGGNTVIQSVNLDGFGHVIGLTSKTISIPTQIVPNNATITISAGTGISGGGNFTTDQSFNETISITGTTLSSSLWAAGTSTTEAVISPAKLASAMKGVGINQTWTQAAGQLNGDKDSPTAFSPETISLNTTYQNTSGEPIMIAGEMMWQFSNGFQVSSNNSTWYTIFDSTENDFSNPFSIVIPNGYYYRIQYGEAYGSNQIFVLG
jgi:hypothetical protein